VALTPWLSLPPKAEVCNGARTHRVLIMHAYPWLCQLHTYIRHYTIACGLLLLCVLSMRDNQMHHISVKLCLKCTLQRRLPCVMLTSEGMSGDRIWSPNEACQCFHSIHFLSLRAVEYCLAAGTVGRAGCILFSVHVLRYCYTTVLKTWLLHHSL
jgi:hypothetical protein